MRTDDFWLIVQGARRARPDDGAALASLTGELQRRGESVIRQFEQQVNAEVARLDSRVLRDIATQLWVFTDESWLDFRAWCVSQGREFVDRLTAHPSAVLRELANRRGGPFDPPNGELFLYCADYARVAAGQAVA